MNALPCGDITIQGRFPSGERLKRDTPIISHVTSWLRRVLEFNYTNVAILPHPHP